MDDPVALTSPGNPNIYNEMRGRVAMLPTNESFAFKSETATNGEPRPGRQSRCPGHRAMVRYWRSKNSRYAIRAALPAKRCECRSGGQALSEERGCARPRDTSPASLLCQ